MSLYKVKAKPGNGEQIAILHLRERLKDVATESRLHDHVCLTAFTSGL